LSEDREDPERIRAFPTALLLLAALVLGVACATVVWSPVGSRRTEPIPGALPEGAEECRVCHEDVHGQAAMPVYHADCETCHGGGSLHSESEAVADIRHPGSGDCLACHTPGRDTHLQWGLGGHSEAGLICSDCHNPHNGERLSLRPFNRSGFPDMDAASQLCIECHGNVGSELRYPSHHPVAEGGMTCMSCHDPHEDPRVRPGGADQRCAGCHQDLMGPWTYEHPPVAEDCGTCHAPHGAVTPDLLATAQPMLCIGCHTLNDPFHQSLQGPGIRPPPFDIPGNSPIAQDFPGDPSQPYPLNQQDQLIKPQIPGDRNQAGTFLRRCTDCHGAVHGSYTDEHLRH
jgi:DmsE family decaheme c-type cytochrome